MPYLLFLKKRQNFKLSSAANYRWRFKGQDRISPDNHPQYSILENQHLKSLTSDKTLAKTAIATSADFLVFFDPN